MPTWTRIFTDYQEKLDAESVNWFKENGGLTRKNGDWFRSKLLSRGGSVDALQLLPRLPLAVRRHRGTAAGTPRPERQVSRPHQKLVLR